MKAIYLTLLLLIFMAIGGYAQDGTDEAQIINLVLEHPLVTSNIPEEITNNGEKITLAVFPVSFSAELQALLENKVQFVQSETELEELAPTAWLMFRRLTIENNTASGYLNLFIRNAQSGEISNKAFLFNLEKVDETWSVNNLTIGE